jgi:hypothetical protein
MTGRALAHHGIVRGLGKGGAREVDQAKDLEPGRKLTIRILPQIAVVSLIPMRCWLF